ncbi:MAG: helix-turn-helix domain-containing protein [Dehalococcoidia bacterium]
MAKTLPVDDLVALLEEVADCDGVSPELRNRAANMYVAWQRRVRQHRARAGRPISAEQKALVVDAIAAGLSLRAACDLAGVHNSTIYREIRRDPEFGAAIEDARLVAASFAEERLEEIALDGPLDSIATVRAAEIVLRHRTARYR